MNLVNSIRSVFFRTLHNGLLSLRCLILSPGDPVGATSSAPGGALPEGISDEADEG